MLSLREELENRGFLYQWTDENVFDMFDKGGQAFYFGADPSADSLHLGNFVVFMQAVNYMKKGNKLYMIVGGATGMIGDPGGKDSERSFLDQETLDHNVASITKQVGSILDNLKKLSGYDFEFEVINNDVFYKDMSFLKFLRDVGKYITVNSMINKETVKKRIEDPDKSISYTEFSYMLLQAYDYLRLFNDYGVSLQIAGSDQWGNIVTGVELIRKKLDKQVYGATGPLVLDSSGKKFGKSEGNAIWLDPSKSSPYFVYQYFMNTSDEDVERYLKLFTLLGFDEIDSIVGKHKENVSERYGQKKLAEYVVKTLFGEDSFNQASKISDFLFGSDDRLALLSSLSESDIYAFVKEVGGCKLEGEKRILELCVESGLAESNGDAKKQILAGSIFCNEKKVDDINMIISGEGAINGLVLLRKGKKVFRIVRVG